MVVVLATFPIFPDGRNGLRTVDDADVFAMKHDIGSIPATHAGLLHLLCDNGDSVVEVPERAGSFLDRIPDLGIDVRITQNPA